MHRIGTSWQVLFLYTAHDMAETEARLLVEQCSPGPIKQANERWFVERGKKECRNEFNVNYSYYEALYTT